MQARHRCAGRREPTARSHDTAAFTADPAIAAGDADRDEPPETAPGARPILPIATTPEVPGAHRDRQDVQRDPPKVPVTDHPLATLRDACCGDAAAYLRGHPVAVAP